jgi:RND superfamily putative drug exporter
MLSVVFASLGRFVYRRRVPVVLAWALLLGVGLGVGGQVFGRLGSGSGLRDDAESVVVSDRLSRGGGGGVAISGLIDGRPAGDPAFQAEVNAAVKDLEATPGVDRVTGPWSSGDPLVARDGRAVLVRVELESRLTRPAYQRAVEQVGERLRAVDAPRVVVGGEEQAQDEFQEQAREDLERGETLALPVMLVLLFLVFRGVVAALTPLLVAAVAVAGALLILLGVSHLADISAYSVNVITMLGLGLAVDYSLLVVSRFREERAGGLELEAAIERTMATAGRTVAFSGLTVAASLCGLLAFAEPFLRSLAWGGIGVVLVAVVAAVTLVPALLGLWGRRIRPRHGADRGPDQGAFYRLSRLVQRFAPAIVVLVAALLVLLALPFRHARLENSGLESLPRSSESRQLFETVQDRFQGGGTDPVVVVVESAPGNPVVADYLRRIGELPGVSRAATRQGTPPQVTVLDVIPDGTSEGPVATRLVERIQALERPVAAGVTGPAAFLVDYRDSLVSRLPYALGLIGLATFALLFMMTGSVVVPVKAIVMNVLSLGASFGALVWVFQDGHLSGVRPAGHGRHHHPGADLRVRLRAVHGLRGVPPLADQGGLGPDRRQRPGGRPRPPAHRADRHLGGGPDRGRVPRLRGRGAAHDQGGRPWHGHRRRPRRHRGPDAAGPGDHEADGSLELVGPAGPAPLPRPLRPGRAAAVAASRAGRHGAGRLAPCRSLTRGATGPSSWS